MISSKLTALIIAGLLSISSLTAVAQSNGNNAPVDKGGVPPYTEMNANSAEGKALRPGSIQGGNGGDANGSSTGTGSGVVSGGSSMGKGAEKDGSADNSGTGGAKNKNDN
ncbi:hypothetical protein J2X84_004433 [Pseudomonas corrugata]|uniref:hypothetical protein n=1 Tax=Pseudomonas corrugata TaxID=47879 RepID=UPI002864B0AC|nr:hypothetical protein [Pseudomonas corrugata]MDR7285584.1 hypothetical protein [Pseudomonas corrugata]